MNNNLRILKWSLLCGSIYFLGISAVHMFGVKVPLLFVYYNVPSNAYQDRIISFMAFGWSAFMFTAFTDPQKQSALIKAILVTGFGAVAGLSVINLTTDFRSLGAGIDPRVFWAETAAVFLYWIWLVISYFRSAYR